MRTEHHSTARIERGLALVVGGALTGVAAGQNSWFFDIQYSDPAGVINSLDDTATVYLWAQFDPTMYAYHEGRLDVAADDPIHSGVWTDPEALLGIHNGPGTFEGKIEGETIAGIVTTQLHFPFAGIFAITDNPILTWKATWHPAVLHPRIVSVTTFTSEFSLFTGNDGGWGDFTNSLTEGQGTIVVVPTPFTGALLVVAAGGGHVRRLRAPRSGAPTTT